MARPAWLRQRQAALKRTWNLVTMQGQNPALGPGTIVQNPSTWDVQNPSTWDSRWEPSCSTAVPATLQKCAAVPRRARIQGSWSCVSFSSRLESNKEGEEGTCANSAATATSMCRPDRIPPLLGFLFLLLFCCGPRTGPWRRQKSHTAKAQRCPVLTASPSPFLRLCFPCCPPSRHRALRALEAAVGLRR